MPKSNVEIRKGVYYDSVTLMQLQAALINLPGVTNAGVMMGTDANKALLKQSGLIQEIDAAETDLIISLRGDDEDALQSAFAQIDPLLSRRRSAEDQDYLPKTLTAAVKMLPEAAWVLVSVPGLYAADVAREGLNLGKNVFLYSDNVSLEDEIALKKTAVEKALLVMGPDCGTAIINGIGLGFANKVRQGPIGLIGASGTGLQQVATQLHQLGSGVSHAIGTGGRDLRREVGGITAQQAWDLLLKDEDTKVVVIISKPPSPEVAAAFLTRARLAGKPIVLNFMGYSPLVDAENNTNVHFVKTLDEAARVAASLVDSKPAKPASEKPHASNFAATQKYLRALFSGGTLAYEMLLILQDFLPDLYSNIPLRKEQALPDPLHSRHHTVLDLGEDVFTVGRPHPMLDNTLRLQRFEQEARDPSVAVILLDVVLGFGAHPDPASELAPAIAKAISAAKKAGRTLDVVALVVGTDEDPQDLKSQIKKLKDAGARIETSSEKAALYIGQKLQADDKPKKIPQVDIQLFKQPLQAINVGLESFTESLRAQEATVVHVDWRPPAGGNEKLMSILERMKQKG
ncbi:MAG: acyl-CoA synthetase FdrA [bacterium]